MRYGNLTAITGPMFAGKTNELIKEILYRTYFSTRERQLVGVFKLSVDNRYSEDCIASHDGARVDATVVDACKDIRYEGLKYVFIDETQFFTAPHFTGDLLDIVREMRSRGLDVFCSGLDTDYMGRAFEIMAAIMAEASEIRRLKADCDVCAAPATRTARIEISSQRFIPGASESYRPMCLDHWHDDMRARERLSGSGDSC